MQISQNTTPIAQSAINRAWSMVPPRQSLLQFYPYYPAHSRPVALRGLAQITIGEAALRVAKEMAREILRNGDDSLRHVQAFESLWVRSKYAKEIQTLGTLHDEVWIAQSMGRSAAQIRDWVTSVLKEFAQ